MSVRTCKNYKFSWDLGWRDSGALQWRPQQIVQRKRIKRICNLQLLKKKSNFRHSLSCSMRWFQGFSKFQILSPRYLHRAAEMSNEFQYFPLWSAYLLLRGKTRKWQQHVRPSVFRGLFHPRISISNISHMLTPRGHDVMKKWKDFFLWDFLHFKKAS